ncbi:MAG: YtxH domain-containing protein [Candidatus Cryptobacteroides sp.]
MKHESLFALLAGTAIGVTLGVLFAPEKGEDTRKKIKELAKEGYDTAKDFAADAKVKAEEAYSGVKAEASALKNLLEREGAIMKDSAREKILQQLDKLEKALSKENEIDDQTQTA